LTPKYPWYTPYQFAGNTPVQAIDLDGKEEYHYRLTLDKQGKTQLNLLSVKYSNHHSWLGGLINFDTKITPERYIVSFNGDDYYIAFSDYGKGYGNAYAGPLFKKWMQTPDARIFPLLFYTEEAATKGYTSKAVEDVRQYLATGVINATVQDMGAAPKYENPGHHDPSKPNFNNKKSVLPDNAEDLFNRSVQDPNDPKTRWTKVGDGKDAVYHRFQSDAKDGSGAFHWNGSTDAQLINGTPNEISPNNVPKEIKRLKPSGPDNATGN
jgi:hypothetical protein